MIWKAFKTALFPTTYLSEAEFASYSSTKRTYHNRPHPEADIRIQTSSLKLDIKHMLFYFFKVKPKFFEYSLNFKSVNGSWGQNNGELVN